jgi:spermidine synthase
LRLLTGSTIGSLSVGILFQTASQYHDEITVSMDADGAITLRIGGRRQSTLDSVTGLDAVQPILDFLHLPIAILPQARRALLIGLGGGVLAKRMWHDYPELQIDAAELDPAVVDIAHRFFGVPLGDPRLRVHTGDGRRFVENSPETYDLMVVDAYFGDAMPWAFATEEFFSLAASRLSPCGVLAYNLVSATTGERSEPLRRILAGAAPNFAWAGVFPVGVDCGAGRENLVMAASKVPVDRDELLARIRSRVGGLVTVRGFETSGDAMIDGLQLVGTIEPYSDHEPPEDGLLHT